MTRILITGASGLLGVNIALEAARRHHKVFGVVNRHPLKTKAFTVVEANLLEAGTLQRVLEQTQPDWVIHCAALANIDACEEDEELAFRLNTELPGKLASYVARSGARLIHVSTDAVFDGLDGNYTEEDAPNPINVYARTKLEGERAVADANKQAIIARVNLFGWSLTGKRSLSEFFFYALSQKKHVKGFTDVYFCPLLANDLADLFFKMLARDDLSGLYHVVSSECVTKYQFGVAIAKKFGLNENLIQPTSVQESGLSARRSLNLTLRVDKLARDLGELPPDLSVGIQKYFQLYQQGYAQKLLEMKLES